MAQRMHQIKLESSKQLSTLFSEQVIANCTTFADLPRLGTAPQSSECNVKQSPTNVSTGPIHVVLKYSINTIDIGKLCCCSAL